MWVPVHNEEWDGDVFRGLSNPSKPVTGDDCERGEVVFQGKTLPWRTGRYEVRELCVYSFLVFIDEPAQIRYHHDGKYNVMSLVGPIEIYGMSVVAIVIWYLMDPLTVEKPSTIDFASVRSSLAHIVTLCLDSDPSLIPTSCKAADSTTEEGEDARDPEDFRFWSEDQAERISKAIQQAFDVELTPEVVIADANLSALTNRVLVARSLFSD